MYRSGERGNLLHGSSVLWGYFSYRRIGMVKKSESPIISVMQLAELEARLLKFTRR